MEFEGKKKKSLDFVFIHGIALILSQVYAYFASIEKLSIRSKRAYLD